MAHEALGILGAFLMGREILLSRDGAAAVLTLNRPPGNLMNRSLFKALVKALKTVVRDPTVRVLVVTGDDAVFSEGLDIEEFERLDDGERKDVVLSGQDTLMRLERAPMPTIAAMEGKAMGAGLELALACDMRLSSEDAQFGHPEIAQGIIPMFGNTYRLGRLIGKSRSRSMFFFGEPMPAWEALEIGLIGKVVPRGAALEEARIAAGRLSTQPLESMRATKMALREAEEKGFKKSLDCVIEYIDDLRHRSD